MAKLYKKKSKAHPVRVVRFKARKGGHRRRRS
jgi:hypothetical protein